MRDVKPIVCVILLFSIASCGRRPTDQRVDVKTALLPEVAPDDKTFSDYQPAQAYAASDNGVFARTIFQADAAAGTRIEVRDWKLPPGKQTTPITLPGAAFIEVRSGSGTLQAGDQKQELQLGAIVPVSHNQSFTIANSSQFTMAMRVYVVTGS
jgi:quercetin dioxygenase-like cupin family protein